jgi:hypothetical protein
LVERLQSDLRRDRVEAVCSAMTKRPARQVGSVGHHTRPRNCPDDLYKLVMSSRARDGVPVKGLGQTPPPKVASVEVDASRAKATATLTFGHQPFDVPFVKRNGRWALDDFFGAIGPIRVDLR